MKSGLWNLELKYKQKVPVQGKQSMVTVDKTIVLNNKPKRLKEIMALTTTFADKAKLYEALIDAIENGTKEQKKAFSPSAIDEFKAMKSEWGKYPRSEEIEIYTSRAHQSEGKANPEHSPMVYAEHKDILNTELTQEKFMMRALDPEFVSRFVSRYKKNNYYTVLVNIILGIIERNKVAIEYGRNPEESYYEDLVRLTGKLFNSFRELANTYFFIKKIEKEEAAKKDEERKRKEEEERQKQKALKPFNSFVQKVPVQESFLDWNGNIKK